MKTKPILILLTLSTVLFLTNCKEKPQEVAEVVVEEVKKVDLINDEFPEAKEEVIKTFGAIAQSLKDGDMDKLISFHAYGPKFTEFNAGAPRVGSKENEDTNVKYLAL